MNFKEQLIIEDFDVSGQYRQAESKIKNTIRTLSLGTKHSDDRGQGLLVEVLCNILNYKYGFHLNHKDWCLHHRDDDDTNQTLGNLMLIKNTIHKTLDHEAIVHAMYTFIKNNPRYIDKQIPKVNGVISIKPEVFKKLTPKEELELTIYYLDVLSKKTDRKSPSDCIREILYII